MANTRNNTSIHRTLLIRLSLAAVLLAVVFTAVAIMVELQYVEGAIRERAVQRVEQFERHTQAMSSPLSGEQRRQLARFFDELLAVRIKDTFGVLVAARLHDGRGHIIRDFRDEEAATLIQRAETKSRLEGVPGERVESHFEWNDNHPYIELGLRLNNRSAQSVAYISAIFAVSSQESARLWNKALRVGVAVLLVTLLTAALLYPIILRLLNRLSSYSRHLLDSNLETLKLLGDAIAKRDSDTNAHNYRVTLLSVRLAERLGLDRKTIQGLIKGAFLHDVGKIAISDNILLKPGRLDETEFEVMKTHVVHGLDIIKSSPWLEDAGEVVGCHHEKCDGSGYPNGQSRTGIPVNARIFAIADVFDALTSKRPYKEPYSFEDTMRILEEGKGTHFDPEVLDAFSEVAKPIYEELSGREDIQLEQALEALTRRYFSADQDALA